MVKKRRNVSANLAFILIMFLVVSTVIVFAVLLFLSYENMMAQWITIEKVRLQNITRNIVEDANALSNGQEYMLEDNLDSADPDSINYQITSLLQRRFTDSSFSEYSSIYIVNPDGDIVISEINPSFRFAEDVSSNSSNVVLKQDVIEMVRQRLSNDDNFIDVINNSSSFELISASRFEGTDAICIVTSQANSDASRREFISLYTLPTIIALVIAVALFIGFVWLSLAPVRHISKTVRKVAEGDYSARVDKKYTDEYSGSSLTVSLDMVAMAQTVNEMIDVIENQEKDRGIFISSIAHDIRTPLTSINGFISAMLDGTIPEDKHERYLKLIKNEVDRIRALIISMTEAASLSYVNPEVMEKFSLKDALSDIVQHLEPQLKDKNIELKTFFEISGPNEIYGEAQQLCRVMMNVITNAIKFTPMDGKIRIRVFEDHDDPEEPPHLVVTVEDSGPGVPEEKRKRVFESFYQMDSSRRQEGYGLGLYICKQILSAHKQFIFLDESATLGGAMFVFSLPLPPEESEDSSANK